MTTSPILLLDNVSRAHGRDETAVRALDSVTLTVHAGELVAVMGHATTKGQDHRTELFTGLLNKVDNSQAS